MPFSIELDRVGYRGSATLNGTQLMATGGQITASQDPMLSSGVWGATYSNVANIVAYAWNYVRLEGNVSFEADAEALTALSTCCNSDRQNEHDMSICPDGTSTYSASGLVQSATISCSEGQFVNGDCSMFLYPSLTTGGGGGGGIKASWLHGNQAGLIAYYKTSVTGNGVGSDIISWSASYNSDIQPFHPIDGGGQPTAPKYVILGDVSGELSVTVFGGSYASAQWQQELSGVSINTGGGSVTINLAILGSSSASIQTGSSYTSSDLTYTAIGDGSALGIQF